MHNSTGARSPAIRRYSRRLLNPFRHVANVIRYISAEAVTADGIHRDIYLSNDTLLDGLEGGKSVQIISRRWCWMQIDDLNAIKKAVQVLSVKRSRHCPLLNTTLVRISIFCGRFFDTGHCFMRDVMYSMLSSLAEPEARLTSNLTSTFSRNQSSLASTTISPREV